MAQRKEKNVKIQKKKKHPFKKFVSLFAILIACFLTYNAVQELVTTFQLKQEIKQTNKELAKLKEEDSELKERKKNLEDPDYVKRYARGKYMVTKNEDGEQVFKLPSKEE